MTFSWLPNAISIFRIILVPPILWWIVSGQYSLALIMFVVAGFSDGLDGFLAKRFDWHSRLGGLLDPVADKMLVGGTFIVLAWTGLVPLWLTAIVILRDVVILGGAAIYNFFIEPMEAQPTRISKLNTALELLFILFVLSRAGYGWPEPISLTVLGSAIVVTVVISGVDYVWSWSKLARRVRR